MKKSLLLLPLFLLVGAALAASPDGTVINGAGSIIDAAGNTWTLSQTGCPAAVPCAFINNKAAGYSGPVTELELANGVIYQESGGLWWAWNGTTWTPGAGSATAPALASSVTLNITGALKVVCPVTLANLLAAINSNMNCAVTVSSVSVSTQ